MNRHDAGYLARRFIAQHGIERGRCVCGAAGVIMHHPDYERPHEIVWACAFCHTNHHRNGAPIGPTVDLLALVPGSEPGAVRRIRRQRPRPLASEPVLPRRRRYWRSRFGVS